MEGKFIEKQFYLCYLWNFVNVACLLFLILKNEKKRSFFGKVSDMWKSSWHLQKTVLHLSALWCMNFQVRSEQIIMKELNGIIRKFYHWKVCLNNESVKGKLSSSLKILSKKLYIAKPTHSNKVTRNSQLN